MPADHPPDDLAHRRILKAIHKAIRKVLAEAREHGAPDVLFVPQPDDSIDAWNPPRTPETAEGNK